MYADPQHGGMRFAVLGVIGIGLVLFFLLLRVLLDTVLAGTLLGDFTTLLSCTGAIALALGSAYYFENYLKRVWHSGMVFTLEEESLQFNAPATDDFDAIDITLDWSKRVNVTRWAFRLANYPRAGRERMVSDKWVCLACQLQQDSSRLIVYAYYAPEDATKFLEDKTISEPFHEISLAALYQEAGARRWNAMTRPALPADMLAGRNGRYWLAERRRWEEGLELEQEDFSAFTAYVEDRLDPTI